MMALGGGVGTGDGSGLLDFLVGFVTFAAFLWRRLVVEESLVRRFLVEGMVGIE